jgi:hypothetical protein
MDTQVEAIRFDGINGGRGASLFLCWQLFYTATPIPECFHVKVFLHFWTSAVTPASNIVSVINPLIAALRWSNAILCTTAGWPRDFTPWKSLDHAHIHVRSVQHLARIKLPYFLLFMWQKPNSSNFTAFHNERCLSTVLLPRTPVRKLVNVTQHVQMHCKCPVLCAFHNKVHLKVIISKEWGANGIMHNTC